MHITRDIPIDIVTAIQDVPLPRNVGDIRRFLGMVNQMGKFIPNLAQKTKSLRDLLVQENLWTWGEFPTEIF